MRLAFVLLVAFGIVGSSCRGDELGCGLALNTHDDAKIARSCSDDGRSAEQRFRKEVGFHRVVDLRWSSMLLHGRRDNRFLGLEGPWATSLHPILFTGRS
jgi:hypothetical protein